MATSIASLPPDLPILNDPTIPSRALLGDGVADVFAAVLGDSGSTVTSSRPTQTTYYPGRSLTVAHDVEITDASGESSRGTIVLSAGRRTPADALRLSDGDHEIMAWRVPHDPWLPGLAPVLDPASLVPLLREIGLDTDEPQTRLRAYRPGRRAVVEVTAPGVRVFLKVVPPASVEALQRRHAGLAGSAPVPRSLGWSPDHGVVVLQALPGRTMREAIFAGAPLPSPEVLTAVLDALAPNGSWDGAEDTRVNWRAGDFAGILGAIVPELAERTHRLANEIAPFELRAAEDPVIPVHGDFYEAQLLVSDDSVTGILDVDTYGPGRRVDDLATMIGHLAVLALGSADRAGIEAYAAHLLAGFDREVDPAVLRAATAGVVLGLATGSFRVMETAWREHTEARVALAEAWMASAHQVSGVATPPEKSLTPASPAPQP